MAQPLQVQPFRSALGLPIGTVIDDSFPQAGDMARYYRRQDFNNRIGMA